MGKTTKLLSNNINGYLFENGKKKYYRLRGNEFARYADNEIATHEKRAKIDKYTEVVNLGRSKGIFEVELKHPRWPKSWKFGAKTNAELKLWIRSFGIAGAKLPDKDNNNNNSNESSLKSSPSSSPSIRREHSKHRSRRSHSRDAHDKSKSPDTRPPPPSGLPPGVKVASSPSSPLVEAIVPPMFAEVDDDDEDDAVAAKPSPPRPDSPEMPLPPADDSSSSSDSPQPPSRSESQEARDTPTTTASAPTSSMAPTTASSTVSSSSATEYDAPPRLSSPPTLTQSAVMSSPVAATTNEPSKLAQSMPNNARLADDNNHSKPSSNLRAIKSQVYSTGNKPSASTLKSGHRNTVSSRDAPRARTLMRRQATITKEVVPLPKGPRIVNFNVDPQHVVQVSGPQPDKYYYYRTKASTETTPVLCVPKQASGDAATFAVAKGRTIAIAVSVVGIERDDQQLSLGFTCDGVKLRVGKAWLLNGREVRAEAINCDKATVITLFVAIKHFEPPRSRVFVTARIKNSTAQKRIVVDVLQKIGEVAPPSVLASPRSPSPRAAATTTTSTTSGGAVSARSVDAVVSSPRGAPAPVSLRELGLDERELTTVTDVPDDAVVNATYFVSKQAEQESGAKWNLRVISLEQQIGSARPLFGVKLRSPFPVRVRCGDADSKLSLTLLNDGKKLKAGRDWHLHSQSERRVDSDGAAVTLHLVIDSAEVGALLTLLAGRQDDKAGRKAIAIQTLPPDSTAANGNDAVVSPRQGTSVTPATSPRPAAATGVNSGNNADRPLPDGWKRVKSSDSQVYYYHAATKTTQRNHPSDPTQADDLPPDWRPTTSSKGIVYFYNTKTKATSWKRPAASPPMPTQPAASKAAPLDVAPAALFAAPTPTGGDDSSTGYESDSSVNEPTEGTQLLIMPNSINNTYDTWMGNAEASSDDEQPAAPQPAAAQPTPNVSAATTTTSNGAKSNDIGKPQVVKRVMAPGWKQATASSGKVYFFNKVTGETSWVFPAADKPKDTPPLPPNWKVATSSSGADYYYNSQTKETRWTRPEPEVKPDQSNMSISFVELSDSEDDDEDEKANANTKATANTQPKPSASTESTPKQQQESSEPTLPAGWSKAVSKSTGKTYYFNKGTGETSWVLPKGNGVKPDGVQLPPGWRAALSSDGRTYYFKGKQRQWTIPTE